jgi:hypothetical protein
MKNNFSLSLLMILFFCTKSQLQAQYSSKKIMPIHKAYTDSIKKIKYTKIFPIWGQKTYEKGFDIPYPVGIMTNYFWVKQGLLIDNLQLGFKNENLDAPLTEADFLKFGNNYSTAETFMVRPDLWLFPFLNVYGIFGTGNSVTEVNIDKIGSRPLGLKSVVEQSVKTAGFGATAAGGVGPVWVAVDGNISWTKPELLDKSVKVSTFGLRLGHNFVHASKPYRNIGVWVGAMRVSLSSETRGQIKLNDALPPETWEKAEEISATFDAWYEELPAGLFKRKIEESVKPIFDAIGSLDGEGIVKYGIDKSVKQPWNGLVGMQYQHNKNWMLRSEAGLIGDRKSFLLSLNYRFN